MEIDVYVYYRVTQSRIKRKSNGEITLKVASKKQPKKWDEIWLGMSEYPSWKWGDAIQFHFVEQWFSEANEIDLITK